MLVAVGTALLPDAGGESGPARTVQVVPGPSLAQDLLTAVISAGDGVSTSVVTTPVYEEQVRRAVGFCRQALRTDGLVAHVVRASPFRAAVLLHLADRLACSGGSPQGAAAALVPLERSSGGVVVARSVARLRSPAPRPAHRLLPARRGWLFVAVETQGTEAPVLVRSDDLRSDEVLDLVPGTTAPVDVWLAPSPRPVDVSVVVKRLQPRDVVVTAADPCWWRHRGAPVTELVVVPADLGDVAAQVRERAGRAYPCYWCRAALDGPSLCGRCGADARAVTPGRRQDRAAFLPGPPVAQVAP